VKTRLLRKPTAHPEGKTVKWMQYMKFSSSIFFPEDGLFDSEDEGTMFFLNGSNCFPINTVKHPRRSGSK
jgi:hypothetical protein